MDFLGKIYQDFWYVEKRIDRILGQLSIILFRKTMGWFSGFSRMLSELYRKLYRKMPTAMTTESPNV